MSKMRTGLLLDAGKLQYDSAADGAQLHQREVFIPLTTLGDSVRVNSGGGTPVASATIRAAAVLTGAYVQSTAVDLSDYNSVVIVVACTVAEGTLISNIKFQWSIDATNYYDEKILVNGAPSGGVIIQTPNSRVVQLSMAATGAYIERFNRLARYLKVAVAESTGVGSTTGKIAIYSQKLCT